MKIIAGDFGSKRASVTKFSRVIVRVGFFRKINGREIADVSIVDKNEVKTHDVKVSGFLLFGLMGLLAGSLFDDPRTEVFLAVTLVDGRRLLAVANPKEHRRLAGAALQTKIRLAKEADILAARNARAAIKAAKMAQKAETRAKRDASHGIAGSCLSAEPSSFSTMSWTALAFLGETVWPEIKAATATTCRLMGIAALQLGMKTYRQGTVAYRWTDRTLLRVIGEENQLVYRFFRALALIFLILSIIVLFAVSLRVIWALLVAVVSGFGGLFR